MVRPWKILGKIVAALLALFILIVLVFIAINSIDRAPSPTALEFQQAWDNRKAVDDSENGYIYLAGFDAATDEEPEVVGKKRIQLSNDIVKGIASNDQDLFRAEYKIEDAFIKEVKTVFDQCATINKNCIEAVEKNKARIIEWSQAENVIGERYTQLISHSHWLELASLNNSVPFPNYGLVIKAQRFAFIREFAALKSGETASFTELLDKDLLFWRTVLENTDVLIGKMIAITAIKNNFLWTNYFLLSLNQNNRATAVPNVVQKKFTNEELSIHRSFIGEWVFASNGYDGTKKMNSDKFLEKLNYKFLFKKQDTINGLAAALKKLIDEQNVSLAEFESIIAQKKAAIEQRDTQYNWFTYHIMNPYNPVGKILLAVAAPAYDGYSARVKDLEVFRLGLLASIAHMNNEPDARAKYTSPYKTKPFVINQKQRSITVNGLGKDRNAQMIYSY